MTARVRLVDGEEEAGRSTTTLLASLAARLGTLWAVPAHTAVGSLAAGFAALGREVAQTAEGARLHAALEAGGAGANGALLWERLRIADWVGANPPAPVLDQLRNDIALVLADDVQETIELLPIPPEMTGARGAEEPPPPTFADFTVGFWAFSREVVRAVEALAEPTLPPGGTWERGPAPEPDTRLLR